MSEMDDAVKEFLVESYENLDRLDNQMVKLEEAPDDRETLASIFRTIHTVKGTCGFLGFGKLESVAHVGESLLARLRDGHLRIDAPITTALLALVDAVRQMLAEIEQDGQEGNGDYRALVATLTQLQQSARAPAPAAAAQAAPATSTPAITRPASAVAPAAHTPVAIASTPVASKSADGEPPLRVGDLLIAQGRATPESVREALALQKAGDKRPLGEILVANQDVIPTEVAEALHLQGEARGVSALSDSNIRVDVGLLDRLMNLVGELVLARNQILQFTSGIDDSGLVATTQRLNLVTTELQENVMKTRMQPIGNVWSKFPRVVRDVAKACGKEVRLELEGKETELDKTIIEAIKDPLTHIVRNSIDHGIETPSKRQELGKPDEGTIRLRAEQRGSRIVIEVIDDGAGINQERVLKKAQEKGLVSADAQLSDDAITNLIFLPGFSTAAQVTNVSGRGVGMDVVRTNIEKIGGSVDVSSVAGKGTTLKIKIPLTLAIIPALVVTTCGERYAIPQVSLLELVRLEGVDAQREIEDIQGSPVYRLRGKLLPLVHLTRALELEQTSSNTNEPVNIVVLQADERQFGLIVDKINDTEEIVVKPLAKQLKGIAAYAGATIMGDGRVALILDVLGLAQRSKVLGHTPARNLTEERKETAAAAGERQTLLVFRVGEAHRMALPLSDVARLEEFPRARVERAGDCEVTQYRGEILPLLGLSALLGWPAAEVRDPQQVVVFSKRGRSVGLVVDQILDIVDESCVVQTRSRRPGTLGSVVIQERVTDLLDIEAVLRRHDPHFFECADSAAIAAHGA